MAVPSAKSESPMILMLREKRWRTKTGPKGRTSAIVEASWSKETITREPPGMESTRALNFTASGETRSEMFNGYKSGKVTARKTAKKAKVRGLVLIFGRKSARYPWKADRCSENARLSSPRESNGTIRTL